MGSTTVVDPIKTEIQGSFFHRKIKSQYSKIKVNEFSITREELKLDLRNPRFISVIVRSEIKKPEAGEETDEKTSKVAKEEHAVTCRSATARVGISESGGGNGHLFE
ncbi:hypothetical protein MKW92_053957 [Papaver armeniacum]|nr:hypothetical protein MKW92_053957 [Papaver armeniacum]